MIVKGEECTGHVSGTVAVVVTHAGTSVSVTGVIIDDDKEKNEDNEDNDGNNNANDRGGASDLFTKLTYNNQKLTRHPRNLMNGKNAIALQCNRQKQYHNTIDRY